MRTLVHAAVMIALLMGCASEPDPDDPVAWCDERNWPVSDCAAGTHLGCRGERDLPGCADDGSPTCVSLDPDMYGADVGPDFVCVPDAP